MLGLVWPDILEFLKKEKKKEPHKSTLILFDMFEMMEGLNYLNHCSSFSKLPKKF